MTDERDPLEQRLRQALPTDVPDATRDRHLAALDASLKPRRGATWGLRHRIGSMLAAAAAALTPVGVAVAAESAVPGDALYRVKQVTEQVQALVRDEVVLEHRIDELDTLLDRDAEDEDLVAAVDRGFDAATDQPDEPELQERFAGLALEAARRVDRPESLALDRLPTRRAPRPEPTRPIEPTVRPTPRPTDAPTSEPSTRPTDRPSPTPEATSSPRSDATVSPSPTTRPDDRPTDPPPPSPSPSTSPKPSDSPSPRPDPSPMPPESEPPADDQPRRTERHEARDAGVVFIDVYADGIRVAGVRVHDGWEHRVERSREPETSAVVFRKGDREIVLFARWRDGRVIVSVEEKDRATDDGAAADAR